MSEDIKKITPEELDSVQEIRAAYQEITVKLGQIQIQRLQIGTQLEGLNNTEEGLRKEWTNIQESERKALQDLQEKYGKVNINLDSGEINES
jgi:allophanate hydrolase subunit 1